MTFKRIIHSFRWPKHQHIINDQQWRLADSVGNIESGTSAAATSHFEALIPEIGKQNEGEEEIGTNGGNSNVNQTQEQPPTASVILIDEDVESDENDDEETGGNGDQNEEQQNKMTENQQNLPGAGNIEGILPIKYKVFI